METIFPTPAQLGSYYKAHLKNQTELTVSYIHWGSTNVHSFTGIEQMKTQCCSTKKVTNHLCLSSSVPGILKCER